MVWDGIITVMVITTGAGVVMDHTGEDHGAGTATTIGVVTAMALDMDIILRITLTTIIVRTTTGTIIEIMPIPMVEEVIIEQTT